MCVDQLYVPNEIVRIPEMAGNFPSGPETKSEEFFVLFRRHWDDGTGLAAHDRRAANSQRCWTVRTFADAMQRASGRSLTAKTVLSWLGEGTLQRLPQQSQKDAILRVFFPSDSDHPESGQANVQRNDMERAWQEAQLARSRARTTPYRDDSDISAAWIGAGKPYETPVASLVLDPPRQGNEPDTPWYVRVKMWLDVGEYEAGDGTRFYLALRRAFLRLEGEGCRIVNGSLLGSDMRPHINFRRRSNGTEIVGPMVGYKDQAKVIIGDPLGRDDEYIAQIGAHEDESDQQTITASLYAIPSAFAFSHSPDDFSDESVIGEEKNRVLSLLIGKGRQDEQRRILVAEDTMKRKKTE